VEISMLFFYPKTNNQERFPHKESFSEPVVCSSEQLLA